MKEKDTEKLERFALHTRAQVLRMIRMAGSGHLAGSLDMADVFAYFYNQVLKVKPEKPDWSDRDLFLLSSGHICPVWYATLSQMGYFPEEDLLTLRQLGSKLQGHPQRDVKMGIENSAGPLGQGVSQAAGAAYQLKKDNSSRRVFVVSSDGEQQEGQVWEAYLFAANYHLDNLTVIIDANGIQLSGPLREVMEIGDLAAKMQAFGWEVITADGHNFYDLDAQYQRLESTSGKPKCLICQTIPGKGISLLEGDAHWHGTQPSDEQWQEIFGDLAAQMQAAGVDLAKDA